MDRGHRERREQGGTETQRRRVLVFPLCLYVPAFLCASWILDPGFRFSKSYGCLNESLKTTLILAPGPGVTGAIVFASLLYIPSGVPEGGGPENPS